MLGSSGHQQFLALEGGLESAWLIKENLPLSKMLLKTRLKDEFQTAQILK
jgi:hypothetical protein